MGRGELLPRLSTLTSSRRYISVALFLGSPPADVICYPCPAQPGLSSYRSRPARDCLDYSQMVLYQFPAHPSNPSAQKLWFKKAHLNSPVEFRQIARYVSRPRMNDVPAPRRAAAPAHPAHKTSPSRTAGLRCLFFRNLCAKYG